MAYFAAIDLGATSGRVAVGEVSGALISYEIVHRFPNQIQSNNDGNLVWDFAGLLAEIEIGLTLASAKFELVSVAVDSWAVDYLLYDKHGNISAPTYAYRDFRTDGVMEETVKHYGREKLYKKSGIQFLPFNTVFQLIAAKRVGELNADHFLMVPDAVNNFLCGSLTLEITNASSTALLDAIDRTWDTELIGELDLPLSIFPSLHEPGTDLGKISLGSKLDGIRVVAVGSHDTASAVAGTPLLEPEETIYISSGTWSLVGCESKVPNTSPAALGINLTNELGVAGTVRNLKNVSGMWIISELMREWRDLGNEISIEELVLAAKNSVIEAYINPNSPTYIHPGQMQAKVQDECRQTGQPVPTTVGEIARCVYQSLAKSYASTIREISEVLSRNFKEVVVVGGGAANSFLNQLTADATRLPVRVGPVEATLLGNIGVQAIAAGVLESLPELRQIIARCYPGEIFTPTI